MDFKTCLVWIAATTGPSLILAWALGFVVRRFAPQWGLVDQPGIRKVHSVPVPLGGGLAIWGGVVGTFAVATAVLLLSGPQLLDAWTPTAFVEHLEGLKFRLTDLWVLLSAASVLMVLGLLDDRRGLHWTVRLAVQFGVAAFCVVWQGWRLTAFIPLPWLTAALSVLWIVTLVNSFNMLDNMDGLSAGVAAIAATILGVFLLLPGQEGGGPQLFVAGLLFVLVGALLGFLWHNKPPAKMFMGDAGSYFIGFCIAIATLLATYTGYNSQSQHAVLAPLCVMAVPLYDLFTVLAIRLGEGRSPFEGDKSHFSHRLTDLGLTKPQAVATVHLTTAACGMAALLLHQAGWFGAMVVVVQVMSVLALIYILESAARRTRG